MPALLYAVDLAADYMFSVGDWLQRNAAAVTLIFTVALIYFTRELSRVTRDLYAATKDAANAATKSAETASDAFTKLERPYMFVFGVTKLGAIAYVDGAPIGTRKLSYSVGNYGKMPAVIEDARAQFSVDFEPESPLGVDDSHDLIQRPVFSAQETRSLPENVPDQVRFDGQRPILEAGRDLFLWIVIEYRGPFTSGHETSACWRYDPQESVFVRFGDEEYNYTK